MSINDSDHPLMNRYTISQSYSNSSTLSLTEPLSQKRMMGLLEILLESENLTEVKIKRVTKTDLNKLCISWLIDEWEEENPCYKAMILNENLELWPFPLIILDDLPDDIIDKYNKDECEPVIKWLWFNQFTSAQKRHLIELYDKT